MRCSRRKIRWKAILGWLAVSGGVTVHAGIVGRELISSKMVVQALHVRGIDVDVAKVHLPMLLDAAGLTPKLEVIGSEREAGGRLRLRMRCAKLSECNTFMATLDVDDAEAVGVLRVLKGVSAQPPSVVNQTSLDATVVHAGARVLFSLQEQHSSIDLPCYAIDTGRTGDRIRVATLDRRLLFKAVIVSSTRVKGFAE